MVAKDPRRVAVAKAMVRAWAEPEAARVRALGPIGATPTLLAPGDALYLLDYINDLEGDDLWSRDHPTEPDYYWTRSTLPDGPKEPELVRIVEAPGGELLIIFVGTDMVGPLAALRAFEWQRVRRPAT